MMQLPGRWYWQAVENRHSLRNFAAAPKRISEKINDLRSKEGSMAVAFPSPFATSELFSVPYPRGIFLLAVQVLKETYTSEIVFERSERQRIPIPNKPEPL